MQHNSNSFCHMHRWSLWFYGFQLILLPCVVRFILIYNYFQHDFLNIYFLFHYLIISSLKSSKIDKVTNMSMGLHLNLLKSIKVEEPSFRLLLLVVVAAVATFFLLLSSNIRPSPHSFFEKPMKHLFLLLPFPYLIQILSNIISFVYPCHF